MNRESANTALGNHISTSVALLLLISLSALLAGCSSSVDVSGKWINPTPSGSAILTLSQRNNVIDGKCIFTSCTNSIGKNTDVKVSGKVYDRKIILNIRGTKYLYNIRQDVIVSPFVDVNDEKWSGNVFFRYDKDDEFYDKFMAYPENAIRDGW